VNLRGKKEKKKKEKRKALISSLETLYVSSEVGTEFLNIIYMDFRLQIVTMVCVTI
jgi:hypothetical protein